jgi:uncharacterized protein
VTLLPLAAVVLAAFVIEATIGFGATVVAVSLGAFLLPVDELLYVFVPLNVALSAALLSRGLRLVEGRLLVSRVLPFMALGLPAGMMALTWMDPGALKGAFGAFVVVLSAFELAKKEASARALPVFPTRSLLVLAGIVHGAFATGGPLVV